MKIEEDMVYESGDSLIKILKIIDDDTAIYIKYSYNHRSYNIGADFIGDLIGYGFTQKTNAYDYSWFVEVNADHLR